MRKFIFIILLVLSACRTPAYPQLFVLPVSDPKLSVRIHPEGNLYVGDQISFEVIDPLADQTSYKSVLISLGKSNLAEEDFQSFGMGGRRQATFYWVWDTHGLEPGEYKITFTLLPGSVSWNEKIWLYPGEDLPNPEAQSNWESIETECCVIHYISKTDSDRDLEVLKTTLDVLNTDVEQKLGVKNNKKIPITFIPRTLGHGGFTSGEIYVSYLHQNYAGSTARQISHHEMVHWLDNQIGGELRPSILEEGLAVYLSNGHFKEEPILPRAAVLLDLGLYIPLKELANTFYFSQHEVSYTEAAALVSYLVTTYGWESFNKFYREISPVKNGSISDALDVALQTHFGKPLAGLETDFLNFLRLQTFDEKVRIDFQLTVSFYNTVRRYQQKMDPSAYFLYAWLPDVPRMRKNGIVADFIRHPDFFLNWQIETLLVSADKNLLAENYRLAQADISMTNSLLDLISR